MTLKTIRAAAALIAISTTGTALAETVMLPGLYETITRSAGEDDAETTRDCVTPAEVKTKTVERKLAEALKSKACTYTQRSFGGGKFALAGACSQSGVKSRFKQTGTYSPTTLNLNMKLTMSMGGQPISVDLTSSSRRIAPTCPAGSDDE